MATVAIIGAGDTGGATAEALARTGAVDSVLLVDEAHGVARGKALDLRQAGAITGSRTRLEGTDAVADVRGCDVCVVADPAHGDGRVPLGRLITVAGVAGGAPLVFAGTGQAAVLASAATDLALPWRRLAGSGGLAMASAAIALVAMEAACSPREVSLVVLGAPGGGWVVPWGGTSIGGAALDRVLAQPQVRRLDAQLAQSWPPGPYALGTAAARLVRAMVGTSREALPVLTMLDGAFGVRERLGVVPGRLSPLGIAEVVEPALTPRDLTALHTALGW
jgi:malate dehydrogenase